MFDENEITRLVNGYIDGELNAEDTRKLATLLEQSHDVKDRLALSHIVERVLRATVEKPLSGQQVMGALQDKGLVQAQKEVLSSRRKQAADRVIPGGRQLWQGGKPSGQQRSGLAVAVAAVVCLIVAAGAWQLLKT